MRSSVVLLLLTTSVLVFGENTNQIPSHEPFSEDLIKFVNSRPNGSWIASKSTRFQNVDDLRVLLGAWREPKELRSYRRPTLNHVGNDDPKIPEDFDSRINWPKCATIKDIRDQSSCGSCWAFGAVTAMSDRICIHSKNQDEIVRLSAVDLLSCCDYCGFGCVGGWVGTSWDFWKQRGLVDGLGYGYNESCKPYPFPPCEHHTQGEYGPCPAELYATPDCVMKCENDLNPPFWNRIHRAKSSYNVQPDMEAIQLEIMQHGPVEAAFNVYADFGNYKSGVYQHTTGELLGGHAIRILGWGVDKKSGNTPYWLIANSWNEHWGEKGLFRMLRGKNHCGIESDVSAGLPN